MASKKIRLRNDSIEIRPKSFYRRERIRPRQEWFSSQPNEIEKNKTRSRRNTWGWRSGVCSYAASPRSLDREAWKLPNAWNFSTDETSDVLKQLTPDYDVNPSVTKWRKTLHVFPEPKKKGTSWEDLYRGDAQEKQSLRDFLFTEDAEKMMFKEETETDKARLKKEDIKKLFDFDEEEDQLEDLKLSPIRWSSRKTRPSETLQEEIDDLIQTDEFIGEIDPDFWERDTIGSPSKECLGDEENQVEGHQSDKNQSASLDILRTFYASDDDGENEGKKRENEQPEETEKPSTSPTFFSGVSSVMCSMLDDVEWTVLMDRCEEDWAKLEGESKTEVGQQTDSEAHDEEDSPFDPHFHCRDMSSVIFTRRLSTDELKESKQVIQQILLETNGSEESMERRNVDINNNEINDAIAPEISQESGVSSVLEHIVDDVYDSVKGYVPPIETSGVSSGSPSMPRKSDLVKPFDN
jgi:hypothetical protein